MLLTERAEVVRKHCTHMTLRNALETALDAGLGYREGF